jgi:hypothetical protein
MKLFLAWLLACAALVPLPASVAFAADSIRVLGFGADGVTHEYVPALPGIFSKRDEKISIVIDGAAVQPAYLRADLFQVAGKLAMPLAKDLHLREGITFPNGARQVLAGFITIPEVKRRTEVLIQLALVPNGSPVIPIHLMDIRLVVFPTSITQELTDLLQPASDGSARVVVFGSGQKLRHFLTSLHVLFEDGGAGVPDRFDADRFYLGELATNAEQLSAQDRSAGARLALFASDDSLPPGIYANRSSTGVLINVSLPMLDNLTDDPLAQLALMKIIRQLSASSTSAN